ncbi:MAG: class I SAM-dependent methyltransferase, partial [Thermomicrobiales bacterium]
MHYLELLDRLHEAMQPQVYLEIGGELGSALALSRTRSILIDPELRLRPPALAEKHWIKLYRQPSDEFFRAHSAEATLEDIPLDLVFIDGFHEFTQVVRDLENVERWGHANTVVVIHDVVPVNALHASRQFRKGPWTGDVWRIAPFLREHRPDLVSRPIAVADTGALVVTGLDPAFRGMAEQAEAVNRDFPPDGPAYDVLVTSYLASLSLMPPAEFFRDYPSLARPIPHRIESSGWSNEAGIGELTPGPDQRAQTLLIALDEPARFGYRVRMALTARGMDALRLAFRRDGHEGSPQEQRVYIDVARPESLSHELERVAVSATPARSLFELEIEGALGPGEQLRAIAVQPINAERNDVPAMPGMVIALPRIEIEQIPAVSRVVHHLPEHFADRPRPAKRRRGLRDVVVFAWFVPPRMPELGEYYLNLLRYYHPDSKLFIGMNHGSDPGWDVLLRKSELDVEVRWARPDVDDHWDTTGSIAALESFHQSEEEFDLVWFGHTKGASGAKHTDYHRNRLEVQRDFWARR